MYFKTSYCQSNNKKNPSKKSSKNPTTKQKFLFHSKWTKIVLNEKLIYWIEKPTFLHTYLSTTSFRIRLARLLSTFLNIFVSFFFRGAVVGVEGLFVLLFLGAAWRGGKKKKTKNPR